MYAAETTKLPECVDYSLRDEEFEMDQNLKAPSRSETSYSDISLTPLTPRGTATQYLADFLRTSSPEDYKRYLGPSSEDLSTNAVSWGSFRFLKLSTPVTSPMKKNTTPSKFSLPSKNVVSKITSKGQPYLQIRVDYGETYFESRNAAEVSQRTSSSSEIPPDLYRRNSIVTSTSSGTDSGISSRASYSSEQSLNPPPRNAQESKVSLNVATMGRYQQFLDSGPGTGARSNSIGAVPNPYTSGIVSAGMAELRAYQESKQVRSRPRSPGESSAPCSPSGVEFTKGPSHRRSRSDGTSMVRPKSQAISTRSSVTSDIFDDATDTEFKSTTGTGLQGQRRKSRKAPPRPGPPPNRCLPSLPESHTDLRPDIEDNFPFSARNPRVPFTSMATSPVGSVESIRSDRKVREERVKARKAKDINQHKQLVRERNRIRQSLGSSIGSISGADSDSGGIGESSTQRSARQHSTSSGGICKRPSIAVLSEQPTSSTNSLPSSPSSSNKTHTYYTPSLDGRFELPASPVLSSPVHSSPTREMDLEARMLAVERKNKMLEQALMAVIRSALKGQAQRRTELFKANDMEELLDGLDLEEFPMAFATGSQLV